MAQGDAPEAEPVWLDLEHEQLRRGDKALHLRPKSFALLRHLVAHPGRMLSKDELMQAVWPNTAISDGVLTVSIAEIRQALGDAVQAPQHLETVPRRGYRWQGVLPTTAPLPEPAGSRPAAPLAQPLPIGREAEVMQLHDWLAQARRGTRQVGFITGEAGIGKTTVADAFVAQVSREPDLWLARGQCIESYGAGEAYLPVLEALGQLCRGPDGARLVAWLAQHAPTWLVQMPALLTADALEAVQRRVLGATRERMLREFAEALETLTTERTLVLVLEDLHWSDAATLDLVGALARRRTPAHLLLLATYRPVDVIVRAHPLHSLKLDLTLHRQCRELPLQLLTAADVAQYLALRFGAGVCPAALGQALHRRTDGHPLFLVTVADALVQQGLLQEGGGAPAGDGGLADIKAMVPESLQQMIAQQLARLSAAQQQVLDAASIVGVVFSAAAVAAGVEDPLEAVEEQCAGLARQRQFLQADGVEAWPDGTVAGRYRFRHALDQAVLYGGDLAAARAHLEQGIAAHRSAQPHAPGLTIGEDPSIACSIHMTLALWLLGSPAQAVRQAQQAHRLAEHLGHPFSLATTLSHLAVLHLLCGNWRVVQECARAVSALAAAQGFRFYQAQAMLHMGRALAAQGETAPGLAQMQQGLAAIQATGQIQGMVLTLSLLAEAYALDGQAEAGLEVLAAALDLAHTHGLRLWEAEVHRLRGALLLAQHGPRQTPPAARVEEAAACFQRALALARQREARAWELRAATSLARLRRQQGRIEAAHAVLAPVYNWFTEGFDTADLQEARALLGVTP